MLCKARKIKSEFRTVLQSSALVSQRLLLQEGTGDLETRAVCIFLQPSSLHTFLPINLPNHSLCAGTQLLALTPFL